MGMLLSIITPVFNSEKLLIDTIKSIRNQNYKNIEYIVVDGGSTDGTLNVINDNLDVINIFKSEPDAGMYDALAKGFKMATGDVICYLNAGDLFYSDTVFKVINFFSETNVGWLTGIKTECNECNEVTKIEVPFRYKRSLIQKGVYGKYLPYIQQESTFWRKDLLDDVDFEELRSLRFAGDYYLWFCFSKKSKLDVFRTHLGIFKRHDGQLSENLTNYREEINSFVRPINMLAMLSILFDGLLWILDVRVRDKLISENFKYDVQLKKWKV